MKELLFLAHRIPYPPDKGDKIRSFHLLQHLAARYRVHVGAFVDDPGDWAYVDKVRAMCGETCFVPLHATRAKLLSLASLLTGEPFTLRYFRSGQLSRWVEGLLSGNRIDVALVFSSGMAQYIERASPGRVRRILDFVDLDSDKWRLYSERKTAAMRWLYRREAVRLFECERRYAQAFDASLFVSEAEARLFVTQVPEVKTRVAVVQNGVDTDRFSSDREYPNPYPPDQKVLVFTGVMDYWPNVDCVTWFADEVFPRVRARIPDAAFYIVGARPTRTVLDLAQLPGVTVTGSVADTRPYLAHARAAVAPLRIARGVQNKVLEAMAMARPIVASSHAVAGIEPCSALLEWTTDAPESMAELLVRLLGDASHASLCERLREHVCRHYSWQRNLTCIDGIVEGEVGSSGPMDASAVPAQSDSSTLTSC
jgi:sugar transferase (PEP-CTERM/EpsH1 system associated)